MGAVLVAQDVMAMAGNSVTHSRMKAAGWRMGFQGLSA